MSDFERAFTQVIDVERGFQNDARDRGNWTGGAVGIGENKGTKWGISARSYPGEDILNMTIGRARELYLRDFWLPLRGDALKWPINLYLFDDAVNSGEGTAIHQLQRTLAVYDDGIMGPTTIEAANRMNAETQARFLAMRIFEESLLPSWPVYGAGWVKRILLLAQAGVNT